MTNRIIKFRCWRDNKMTFFTPDNGAGLMSYPVMQFTGLLDKSGKEIYEGDIVKRSGIVHVVKWQDEKARFVCYNPQSKHPSYWGLTSPATRDYHFEIIGNIWESPELLTPHQE